MRNLIYLFLIISSFGRSQDPVADFKKVRSSYLNQDFSMSFTVYSTSNHGKTQSKYADGSIAKSGTNYYSTMGNEEYVVNEEGMLVIDHDKRSVHYFVGAKSTNSNEFTNVDVQGMLSVCDTVYYGGESNGKIHYRLIYEKGDISIVDIYINSSTYLITKIDYYYNEDKKDAAFEFSSLSLVYTQQAPLKPSSPKFNTKNYLKKQKNSMVYIADHNYRVSIHSK